MNSSYLLSYRIYTIQNHRFGFSDVEYFTLFKYSCSGDEASLSACVLLSSVNCTTNDPGSVLAANCGEETGGATGETKVQFNISDGSSTIHEI